MLFEVQNEIVKAENRAEWLENRNRWLGASEASALFGVSRFSSEYALWVTKSAAAEIPQEDPSLHMQRGLRFELPIIDEVRETHGWQIEPWPQTDCVVNTEHRIGCTPDCLLIDELGRKALGQIKLSDPFMRSYWENGVPLEYQIQCQTEMLVTGAELAYVIVVFGLNAAAEVFPLERHEPFHQELLDRAAYFWECVDDKICPEADGSDATAEALRALYSSDDGTAIDLSEECDMWASEYVSNKEQIKALEKRTKELKNKMVAALGPHTYAQMGDLVFSYKQQTRIGLDTGKLRNKWPEIAEQCEKVSEFRVLRKTKKIPDAIQFDTDLKEVME